MRLSSSVLSKKTVSALIDFVNNMSDDTNIVEYRKKVIEFLPFLLLTQFLVLSLLLVMIFKPSIPFMLK